MLNIGSACQPERPLFEQMLTETRSASPAGGALPACPPCCLLPGTRLFYELWSWQRRPNTLNLFPEKPFLPTWEGFFFGCLFLFLSLIVLVFLLWHRPQLQLTFDPWPGKFHMQQAWLKKEKKKV